MVCASALSTCVISDAKASSHPCSVRLPNGKEEDEDDEDDEVADKEECLDLDDDDDADDINAGRDVWRAVFSPTKGSGDVTASPDEKVRIMVDNMDRLDSGTDEPCCCCLTSLVLV